jgi:hypothetical protein
VAPELTTLVQPQVQPDSGTTTIPTNADLAVVWNGGQPGATMIFEAITNNSSSYTLCAWNGSDGKDIVPAPTLKPLSGSGGYLVYGQYNVTSFSAGPIAVTLSALPYTGGTVTFQ